MLVTGVQAVGAKGVTAIQGAVVDVKDATRAVADPRPDGESATSPAKAGVPQPVLFPRSGLPMDHRPVSLREHRAAARYHEDGGEHPPDDDAAA